MDNIIEGQIQPSLTPLPRKQGESITMSFFDAMQAVVAGKKVTRISWANDDYCFLKSEWLTIFTKNEKDTAQSFHTW